MKSYTSLLFPFLILLSFTSQSLNAQEFPDVDWEKVNYPAFYGWNPGKMNNLNRYVIDSTTITSMMIIHKGKVVYEFGNTKENSYIASCRKSVLSMLYGKYVTDGTIDLSATLEELEIDKTEPLLEIEKKATIKDLISARSGVYLFGSNGGDARARAPERGSKKPGEFWLYSNWDFNMAGYVFEKITNRNIYDEIESQFAIPLNMQDWERSLQNKYGDITLSEAKAYHMWFSTRDLARLGLLMLNNGNWKGTQVIPEEWVAEMTSPRTTNKEIQTIMKGRNRPWSGGYMWWLWDDHESPYMQNVYSALGSWGQTITVYPNIETVLVYNTNSIFERRNKSNNEVTMIQKVADAYDPDFSEKFKGISNSYFKKDINQLGIEIREFQKNEPSMSFENLLNRMGNEFLSDDNMIDAISIFKLNTELYPNSYNVFDSLGKAYYMNNDFGASALNYQKALSLVDKDNALATRRINQILERIKLKN